MRHPALGEGVGQGAHQRFLALQIREGGRPILACEHAVGAAVTGRHQVIHGSDHRPARPSAEGWKRPKRKLVTAASSRT